MKSNAEIRDNRFSKTISSRSISHLLPRSISDQPKKMISSLRRSNSENIPPLDPNVLTDQSKSHSISGKNSAPISNSQKIKPRSEVSEDRSVVSSDSDSSVKVVTRIRPVSGEREVERIVRKVSSKELSVGDRMFTFDAVVDSDSTQEDVFQLVGVPLVKDALAGFNTSILSYGQSGSGKTYTMWGPQSAMVEGQTPSSYQGIVPRIFEMLFTEIEKDQENYEEKHINYQCRCSFLEIYNEQISDLLDSTQRNLQIRDDAKNGFYIENLTEDYVNSLEDVTQILIKGLSNRKVGATSINSKSSRSHIIFTCFIESWCKGVSSKCFSSSKSSRISFIDLAGSDRSKADGVGRECVKEGKNVKWSLSQLGNLVHVLAEVAHSGEPQNIPYRDSSLTHLLRESLGGNVKLTVICAISPDDRCKGETLSTLRFGQRAKSIQNKAVINEITEDAVNDLSDQIRQLKEELIRVKSNGGSSLGSHSGHFRGHHTRVSLNQLRLSLNRSLILPHIDNDSEEEINVDEEDVRELCVQLDNLHGSCEEKFKDTFESNGSDSINNGSGDDELSVGSVTEEGKIEEMHLRESEKEQPSNGNVEPMEKRNHLDISKALREDQPQDSSTPPDPAARGSPSIIPYRQPLVLEDPPLSASPKIANQKKNTVTSSNLLESQPFVSESNKYNSDFSRQSVKRSDHIRSSLRSSKILSGPTESLAASLQRGLQIIDYHQLHSTSKNSLVEFSFENLTSIPCKDVEKVDAGVQTLPGEGPYLGAPVTTFLCASCKKMDTKQVQDSQEMWIVQVDSAETPGGLKNRVPKGDEEKLLAEATKREKELEIVCAGQEAKIEQLNRLVEQYKYEREHRSIREQSQDSQIIHLTNGIIPTSELKTEEYTSLGDESKPLREKYEKPFREKYENHPEVLKLDSEPKEHHKGLNHDSRTTFDISERETLLEEIQNLRNQLQSYMDASSNDSIKKQSSPALLQSAEVRKSGSPSDKSGEELEKERQRWTEMESGWISLTEELRFDLESNRRLAEKKEIELRLEKKCSEELDDALQRAMLGHARFIEHYAELQEKHNDLLGRHRKIMEGIVEVKKAAAKAGTKGSGSRFIESLAAELSALRVTRERERDYLKEQNKSLRIQLRDTAEAVHAAGELLVRLKEAEEAVSSTEEKLGRANQETEKVKKQMEKLKKKHAMEISTMKRYLAESRLPESALRPIELWQDSDRADSRIPEDDDQDWRAEFGPLYEEHYSTSKTYNSPMRNHLGNGFWEK
ncbi:kinesin motor family protein [Tasmannia lanceolata]|uniref:kinesin motor family protein n=1 Tax=Tasmannia lanceolata TaxID=3420 RepID=UPI004062A1A8